MTVTGGKLVLSGKIDLPRRKYGPMTETNGKSVFSGYGSYASRVCLNDSDGENRYSPGMNPTSHNYVPMTETGGNRYSTQTSVSPSLWHTRDA